MRAKDFRTVKCIDCGKEVPCMNKRMRRCWNCEMEHRKKRYKELLELNEKEITRL